MGTHLEETKTLAPKDQCTPMLIAALFTIARTWRQPKCPSTEEWVKKRQYVHAVECYSAVKNETLPFAVTWMDLRLSY